MMHYQDKIKKKDSSTQEARQGVIDFGAFDDEPQALQEQPTPATHNTGKSPFAGFRYISIGSGSSGNCAYLGNENGGFIVDAGVEVPKVLNTLKANGIEQSMIKGIIVTHDHSDHVRYVYTLLRTLKTVRLYCTPRVLNGLLRRHNISRRTKEYHDNIFKEIPFRLAGMSITAFETSHDASDNMGFDIDLNGSHFVVATDMGEINERAQYYMQRANYLVIETDYDTEMLRQNPNYPEYLKARIKGAKGHLDNETSAQFVAQNYHPGLKNVFLCHLSEHNNTPELAVGTMTRALQAKGLSVGNGSNEPSQRTCDIQVYALPRTEPSLFFIL
mgnify:FL=1